MDNARPDSKKVILLITDGKSNGGEPRSIARRLRAEGSESFGNVLFKIVVRSMRLQLQIIILWKQTGIFIATNHFCVLRINFAQS